MFTQHIWQHNFVPVIEGMSPKAGIPSFIYFLNGTVFFLQPDPELLFAVFTVALSAILIADVPANHALPFSIPLCQLFRQKNRILLIGWTVLAGIVAASKFSLHAAKLGAQNIWVAFRHPRRMSRCRGGKENLQPICLHQIHDLIQFFKIISILTWLQSCPGKYIQGYLINSRQLKKPHILFPDFLRPLLRVVISAI